MLWKSVTALILLFWSVMTVLLVRHSYFSPEQMAREVEVASVLDLAAQPRNITRNTLTLMHNDDRVGHADVAITPIVGEPSKRGYHWLLGGVVEGSAWGSKEGGVVWRFEGDQRAADQGWESISISFRSAITRTDVFVSWKLGDDLPKIEANRDGQLIMDTKGALEQAKTQKVPGLGMAGMMMPSLGNQKVSLEYVLKMSATAGSTMLAGSARDTRTLVMSLLGFYEARAIYTETGELARIDLPQGFRLVDPLIAGIDPHFAHP